MTGSLNKNTPKEILAEKAKFFANCDYTCISLGSFFLCGEYSVILGNPCLVLPINLKTWVGIEFNNNKKFKIEIRHIKQDAPTNDFNDLKPREQSNRKTKSSSFNLRNFYYRYDDQVKDVPELKHNLNRLIDALNNWKDASNYDKYFTVKIWTDIPIMCGLNSSSSIGTALAMRLYALLNDYDSKEAEDKFQDFNLMKPGTLENNKEFLNNIYYLSWYFANFWQEIPKAGVGPLASFIRPTLGRELILYTIKNEKSINTEFYSTDDDNYKIQCSELKKIKFNLNYLKVPVWLRSDCAFSLVYCGKTKEPRELVDTFLLHKQADFTDLRKYLKNNFNSLPSGLKYDDDFAYPFNIILDESDSSYRTEIHKSYADLMGFISWQIISFFIPTKKKITLELLGNLIQEYSALLKAYKVFASNLRELKSYILATKEKGIWIKQTGLGRGGDLLLIGKQKSLENINAKVVKNKLPNQPPESKIRLHYTSLTHGWSNDSDCPFVESYNENHKILKFSYDNTQKTSRQISFDSMPLIEINRSEKSYLILLLLAAHRKANHNKGLHPQKDIFDNPKKQKIAEMRRLIKHDSLELIKKIKNKNKNEIFLDLDPHHIIIDKKSFKNYCSSHIDVIKKCIDKLPKHQHKAKADVWKEVSMKIEQEANHVEYAGFMLEKIFKILKITYIPNAEWNKLKAKIDSLKQVYS